MTHSISLLTKAQFPWILCHQTSLCLKETMNHLMNKVKNLTLATPLAELLEQFQQHQDQFVYLKSAIHSIIHTLDMMQLTDELQHLTIMLQPHPSPQPSEDPMDKMMQAYTDTLHITQREANFTMILLQDIPTFDDQHSSKLEDWFMDIETNTDREQCMSS